MTKKVSELMMGEVFTLRGDETVKSAREAMTGRSIHAIPVLDVEGELLGVLSATDLLFDLPDHEPLSSLMSEGVITVDESDEVAAAAELMVRHQIHHVVVTRDDRMVGMLSSFDFVRLFEPVVA